MGTAVAKRTATAVKHQKSISEMVVQINAAIYDANAAEARCTKLRLKAGQLLLQLRARIESGEEGDVAWWDWFENLGNNGHPALIRSRKDAERLMRIASAEDPEQALLDEREKTRIAVAKHREQKAAELTVSSKPEPDEAKAKPSKVEPITVTIDADLCGEWDDSANWLSCFQDCLAHQADAKPLIKTITRLREILDEWEIALEAALDEIDEQEAASTLPQDGRSEVAVDDPAQEIIDDIIGDIPPGLDRRRGG
jgi:hypothetical protein